MVPIEVYLFKRPDRNLASMGYVQTGTRCIRGEYFCIIFHIGPQMVH